MDKKKQDILFLNQKRKNSFNSLKNNEEDIKYFDNNIINERYLSDNEIKERIIDVKMENNELIAFVEKRTKNNKIKIEEIKTKELKLINPWILINFYENQNINLFYY